MNKFKGTQGEWFTDHDDDVADETGEIIAIVLGGARENRLEDARLISAAPDLLEALQDLSSRAEIYVNTSKAKEAIAKALGK